MMTTSISSNQLLCEQLINTRQAAALLNLPQYVLAQPIERKRYGIPHYRVGKLVRFKRDELMNWFRHEGSKHHA
jgi:excisionase family DNA binding protein